MSISLRSAFKLASYIDNYFCDKITKQELMESYRDFWIKEFYSRIKLSCHFQKLSEFPFLTKLTIGLFNLFPSLAKILIKQTHGKPF